MCRRGQLELRSPPLVPVSGLLGCGIAPGKPTCGEVIGWGKGVVKPQRTNPLSRENCHAATLPMRHNKDDRRWMDRLSSEHTGEVFCRAIVGIHLNYIVL